MYPKQPPLKARKEAEKKKSEIKAKRDSLKQLMTTTLCQKFSEKPISNVKSEIDKALTTQKLTQTALRKMESNIGSLPSLEKPQIIPDNVSVHSEYSKMSGASNFDRISKSKGGLTNLTKSSKPLFEAKRPESKGIEIANEKEEWAMIYKYNTFLSQKETMAEVIKDKEAKKAFAIELTKQLNEKEILAQKDKELDYGFHDTLLKNCEVYDKKLQLENQRKEAQARLEKEMRDYQLKDIKARRRYEEKQEKALDKFIIAKLNEDMEQEKQYLYLKKIHQASVMEKVMAETAERKRIQLENEQKDRQETIQLQEAYCRLLDEQEAQRDKNLKDREENSKKFILQALDMKDNENQKLLDAMEQRADKYKRRLESKLNADEKRKTQEAWEKKLEMRKALGKQMQEREEKFAREKQEDNQQAQMWKTDSEGFARFEKTKQDKKVSTLRAYNRELFQQMEEKERSKQEAKAMVSELDSILKKKLQEEKDYYNSLQVM